MIIFETIITSYLLILFHEVCHCLFFIWQGISIRKFYVFPIELNFFQKHVVKKLKITKKYYGIVIPKIEIIDRENMDLLQKKCARAIISSSYMHVILSFVGGIVYLGVRSDFWLLFVAINLFMFLQGFYETNWAYGDIVAFEKIKGSYIEFILYIAFVILNDDEVSSDNLKFIKGELEKMILKDKNVMQSMRIENCLVEIHNKIEQI